jgi:RNA polymerase sigma-70 factor, ECF subfamily
LTLESDNLDAILEGARRLDATALGQIHDRYYAEVFRYVRYRLGDEAVCEDICSEVFLSLLNALHRRRGPNQHLRAWLMGTASNLVNDHLRHRYKRGEQNLDEISQESLVTEDCPDDDCDEHLQAHQVRQALQKLTSEQQHVLALRFADEYSLEETARVIGKSITAVKALQFRALASLRRVLEEKMK